MIPENTSSKRYWYGPYEGYEMRSQRRLQDDLGVDEAAVEAILRLRRQVIELQSHIRRLEAECSPVCRPTYASGSLPRSLLRGQLDRTGNSGMITVCRHL